MPARGRRVCDAVDMPEIVVGVDMSAGSADALRWAVRQGELREWSVLAAHCTTDRDGGVAALASFVDATIGPDAAVAQTSIDGPPASSLVSLAAGAELLVLGARGLGGFKGLLVGSVGRQCLHHAPSSVAIVHAHAPRHGERERIVVGLDESDPAAAALQWALDEGRLRQATVEVVHGWRMPYVDSLFVPVTDSGTDDYEGVPEAMVDRMLAGADSDGLPEPVVRTVERSDSAAAILNAAGRADLVVVGHRGRGGFAGLLLGSVSDQVAQHAPCPVVVVRT